MAETNSTIFFPVPIGFEFWTEKIAGAGEDAPPIATNEPGRCLLGVFDGMGGAGAATYDTSEGTRTGAYIAARAVRDRTADFLDTFPFTIDDGAAIAEGLAESLRDYLGTFARGFGGSSRLKSRLVRAFPTTMAVTQLTPGRRGIVHCQLFWAGDSRVYVISPDSGAAQLTTDDLKDARDALENLDDDSTMSNCASADAPFELHYRQIALQAPVIVLAATDGCFGYLPTPMHFEHLILTALQGANGIASWRDRVQSAVTAVAGDDASMALAAIGGGFTGIRDAFRGRTKWLAKKVVGPLDAMQDRAGKLARELDKVKTGRARLRAQLWAAYKRDYERYLDAGMAARRKVHR